MNYISPVNHPESYLTGSTIESMIDKNKELGLKYFAVTDNGHLSSILRSYSYAKKNDVKLIAGVELFFRDRNCDIIKNTPSEEIKYFKIVVHAKDQKAYQKIVKMISQSDRNKVTIIEDQYPLFNWQDLEELCKENITICTSNVECMVSKHLLVGRPDLGMKYYEKLRNLVGAENFYPTVIPFKYDKYWDTFVNVELGGEVFSIPSNDRIYTDAWNKASALELTRPRKKHKELKKIYIDGIEFNVKEQYQTIGNANLVNNFVNIPNGDLQANANKFIMALAKRYGDTGNLLINNYAYYSNKDDKVVQDMKLGQDKRLYQHQYMASFDEVKEYLTNTGIEEKDLYSMVENSYKWANNFDNFELKYDYRLPECNGDPLKLMLEAIKKTGRMKGNDPRYQEQFKEELRLLQDNGVINLIPYFLPIIDVFDYYKDNGALVGPARGSAGGFLLSYLMGVTQIDPIKYGLSSSRFLTIDRVQQGNLPDIDVDLESRNLLVGKDGNSGYLKNKYGDRAAQASTRTLLRIKSAILDANRFINNGKVEDEIAAFSKSLPTTPQGISDHDFVFGYEKDDGSHVDGLMDKNKDLQKYAEERPKEWNIVKKALSLSRQNSRHACFAAGTLVDNNGKVGFIDSSPKYTVNKPINTWCSGVRDTVIVSFNNGISIKCTPDHKFMIDNNEVEAKDLVGQTVSYQPFTNVSGEKVIDFDMAFALGWFLNDGAYIETDADRFEFYFTPKKDDAAKERILKWLEKEGFKVTQAKDREDTFRAYRLPEEFKIKQKTHEKRLPREFWKWSKRCQRNFMMGLFSANGYCLSTRPTVAIKLTSKLLISDIAIWLNSNDIQTSCSYSKPTEIEHHNGKYVSRSTAILSIPHFTNKIAFENLVGFIQDYKSERLREIIENALNTRYRPKSIICLAIEESGQEPVWDFNEPLENVGYINGVLVHNCAFVIADCPIEDVVPIMEVGGVKRVTQPEHKQCEEAGLIKYDFLVVNSVKDVRLALDYINKKYGNDLETGYFMHDEKETYIWDLPEDKKVFDMIGDGDTETVFQLNTTSVTPFVQKVRPQSIIDCATITSLVRPGPLEFIDENTGRNMVEEYIERKFGRSKGDIPILDEMLPETYGVLVFQEQITKLAKELAGMDVIDAENVRIGVGKKKKKLIDSLKPKFIEGASSKVDEQTATEIWNMIEKFARYGFNKSHAVAYSVISYACAFLKYHYPLEWWAAVLSNADSKEINEVFYKYVRDIILPPDINTSTEEITIDYNLGKIRNKLSNISGLGSKLANKIIDGRPYKNLEDFIIKKPCGPSMTKKLIHIGALDSFFDKSDNLMDKMSKYEIAVKQIEFENKTQEYREKILTAKKEGDEKAFKRNRSNFQKHLAKGPKPYQVDELYTFLNPRKDFQIKKSIFPTMNLDLNKVLTSSSKTPIIKRDNCNLIINSRGYENPILNGEELQEIDGMDVANNTYFCVPGYIIDASEFSYKGGTRKALKLIIDSSGYISEKVLWPDYETGELKYPESLKKGAIVYFFYYKKPGKPKYTNIIDFIVEEESIL